MTPQSGGVETYRSSGHHSSLSNSGLSQSSFSHGGTDYRITSIYERAAEVESDLYVTVTQLPASSTLRIGGRNYSVHDGEYDADAGRYVWHNSLRFGWANGQSVPVSVYFRPEDVAAPEGDPVWEATLTSAVKIDAQPHLRGHSPAMESAERITPTTFTHNRVRLPPWNTRSLP